MSAQRLVRRLLEDEDDDIVNPKEEAVFAAPVEGTLESLGFELSRHNVPAKWYKLYSLPKLLYTFLPDRQAINPTDQWLASAQRRVREGILLDVTDLGESVSLDADTFDDEGDPVDSMFQFVDSSNHDLTPSETVIAFDRLFSMATKAENLLAVSDLYQFMLDHAEECGLPASAFAVQNVHLVAHAGRQRWERLRAQGT